MGGRADGWMGGRAERVSGRTEWVVVRVGGRGGGLASLADILPTSGPTQRAAHRGRSSILCCMRPGWSGVGGAGVGLRSSRVGVVGGTCDGRGRPPRPRVFKALALIPPTATPLPTYTLVTGSYDVDKCLPALVKGYITPTPTHLAFLPKDTVIHDTHWVKERAEDLGGSGGGGGGGPGDESC